MSFDLRPLIKIREYATIFNDLFKTTLNPRSTTLKANTLTITPSIRCYLIYITDEIPRLFQI